MGHISTFLIIMCVRMSTHQSTVVSMSDSSRPVVLTVANGKGGVGKTSVATNLAAGAAARGIATLLVDLDPQGNTALDLGVYEHDGGRSLGAAVSYDMDLATVDARADLRYSPGGEGTGSLHAVLAQREAQQGPAGLVRLREVLWRQRVDLVVIDTPPAQSNQPVIDAALIASDWLLIPTKHDAASVLGISGVVDRLREVTARKFSGAAALGVVVFGLSSSSKALRASVLAELRDGLGEIPVLNAVVRSSERAAYDLRDRGQTAVEYAAAARTSKTARLRALRHGQQGGVQHFASGAGDLAGDYEALTDEVLTRMGFDRAAVS